MDDGNSHLPPIEQECGHKPYELRFNWLGHGGRKIQQKLCGACAAIVWNKMAPSTRGSFFIDDIRG